MCRTWSHGAVGADLPPRTPVIRQPDPIAGGRPPMSSQPSPRSHAGTAVSPKESEATATLIAALDRTLEAVVAKGSGRTNQGKDIDGHQPQAERIAYFATEVKTAKCLADYACGEGAGEPHIDDTALVFAAEMVSKAAGQLDAHADDLGIAPSFIDETLATPAVRAAVRAGMSDARVTAIGRHQLETRGVNNSPIEEIAAMARDAVRQFAATEVAPIAEHIHRHDDLVPDSLIAKMGELGYFGMAVPEAYGGGGMGN